MACPQIEGKGLPGDTKRKGDRIGVHGDTYVFRKKSVYIYVYVP